MMGTRVGKGKVTIGIRRVILVAVTNLMSTVCHHGMILSWGTDIEGGGRGLFGNETVTMLGLARILRLILVRGCGTRTPAL